MGMRFLQASIFFLLLLNSASFSDELYVDEFGSDVTGDGSIGSPWATVGHTVNQLNDTPTIIYCSGNIDETPNGGFVVLPDSLRALTIDGQGSAVWKVQCNASAATASASDTITICNFAEITPAAGGPGDYAVRVGSLSKIHDIEWIHGYTSAIFIDEETPPDSREKSIDASIFNIGTPGAPGNNGITQNDYGLQCISSLYTRIHLESSNIHDNGSAVDCELFDNELYGGLFIHYNHIWQNGAGISVYEGSAISASSNYIYENSGDGIYSYNGCWHYFTNSCIYGNEGDGIHLWSDSSGVPVSVTIRSNDVYSNGQRGLNLINEWAPIYDIYYVECNNIYSNGSDGIWFESLVHEYVMGFEYYIRDNNVTVNGGTGMTVRLPYCSGILPSITILGNSITQNDSIGLLIDQFDAGDIYCGWKEYPNVFHDNDISGDGIDFCNNSSKDIWAKDNDWGAVTNSLMAGNYYNETDIPAIYDYWEDPAKGFVIWSEQNPVITLPSPSTVWSHEETGYQVMWEYSCDSGGMSTNDYSPVAGDSVFIELYKDTLLIAELSPMTINTGTWTMAYCVPENWGTGYNYRVRLIDNQGIFCWSSWFSIQETQNTGYEQMSSIYCLHNVVPNPSNGTAAVMFEIPEAADVLLTVYDISGRAVNELMCYELDPGIHDMILDDLNTGLYIIRMQTGHFIDSVRMIVVR